MTRNRLARLEHSKQLAERAQQVLTVYVIASAMYGVLGTLIGVALGALASWRLLAYIGGLLNLDTDFSISPARRRARRGRRNRRDDLGRADPSFAATAIRVKHALEAYGISSTYGSGWSDRLVQRIVTLPPLAAMSLRNLARRQGALASSH